MQLPLSAQPLTPTTALPNTEPDVPTVPPGLFATAAAQDTDEPAVSWEASLGVVISDDADTRTDKFGEFPQVEDFKLTPDTLLEIVMSDQVLRKALEAVGPAKYHDAAVYPSDGDVSDLRHSLRVDAPGDTENQDGKALYLKVEDCDRTRAAALVSAILDKLQHRSQEIRSDRARDVVEQLKQKALIASADLQEATEQVAAIEKSVGSDVAILRKLHESPTSDNELSVKLDDVNVELRETQQQVVELTQLRNVLNASQRDPHNIAAMPDGFLKSQPTLLGLKHELVDAQTKLREAQAAEKKVVAHVAAELEIAVCGVDVDVQATQSQAESLQSHSDELHARVERLNGLHGEYAAVLDRVEQHSQLVSDVRHSLTNARAMLASANKTKLIQPVSETQSVAAKIGESRAFVMLSGLVGGMLLGWAALFLSVAPASPQVPAGGHELRESLPHEAELYQASLKSKAVETTETSSRNRAALTNGHI